MKKISVTRQFQRDVARQQKRKKNITKLKFLIQQLEHDIPLPESYRDHKLKGDYHDARECHLEPDWLLVYKKTEDTIALVRTGTHADLF